MKFFIKKFESKYSFSVKKIFENFMKIKVINIFDLNNLNLKKNYVQINNFFIWVPRIKMCRILEFILRIRTYYFNL